VQQQDIDSFCPGVLLLFDEAISQLSAVRAQEGAALKHHIEYRLEHLTNQILCAQNYAHEQVAGSKVRLLARLRSLELEVSEGRVDQEVALMLARMDVAEELDRLTTHVAEVQRILNHESSAGRRLDFLMQELNREANTLSSKSVSSELTQCAIEMKVLIEQMREQIQNIE
jgi:uncharacterized protein (TIGR00255 family)